MSAHVRLAESDADFRAALALRHQVFIGENIVGAPSEDGLLIDVFDVLPSTRIFVAVEEATVVGTVRLTLHGDHAHPCDSWFEWRHLVDSSQVASGSLLCTDPAARHGFVGLELVDAAMALAWSDGARFGVACVRPQAEPVFERLAWRRVDDPFVHPIERVPAVPMIVDLTEWLARHDGTNGERPLACSA